MRRATLATLMSIFGLTMIYGDAAQAKPVARGPNNGVVNINTATPDQLQLLPGIGNTKARRIVTYRTKRKFRATYELIRVRGIGRRTYRKLRRYLTVRGPTTMTQRPMGKTKGG